MLFTAVLFLGLILSIDGYCFASHECIHNGATIATGESQIFKDDCLKCSCFNNMMSCCSIGGYISNLPDDCKAIKDPNNPCVQIAVQKDDETKRCKGPIAMVGR